MESKVEQARDLNNNLQSELDRLHSSHEDTERTLRAHIDEIISNASGGVEWEARFQSLEEEHQKLQTQYSNQEKVTNEVKLKAASWLNEMKALSERSSPSFEKEERLTHQVHALEKDLQDWKTRYARTKTQLRTLRVSSQANTLQLPDAGGVAQSFMAEDGVVTDVHVTKFQIAIDELLQIARRSEPDAVLGYVKSVVIAVRNIVLDLGQLQTDKDETSQQKQKLKEKLSATSSNLITAAKNFATSKGVSPVSLLDAAASHVAAAVVELIHLTKVRHTPADELDDDDENSIIADSPADYYGISTSRASAGGESVYSLMSSPRRSQVPGDLSKASKAMSNGNAAGASYPSAPEPTQNIYNSPHNKIEELKVSTTIRSVSRSSETDLLGQSFLDSRTDSLIPSVQSLVSSIRTNAQPPDILDHMQSITSTTSQIINKTSEDVNSDDQQLNDILQNLAERVDQLEDAGREGEEIDNEQDWNAFVKRLPPLAFGIAKSTKELGGWIEARSGNDDFS